MTDTLKGFYSRLTQLPEIVELVKTAFPDDAVAVLQHMQVGDSLDNLEDELEDLLTEFISDHAVEITSYKGLGGSDNSSREAITYFEDHHPEAAELIKAQANQLEKLLGKSAVAVALGKAREPFDIDVLRWGPIFVVTAEDFEDAWFDNEDDAFTFAQSNYEPWISNHENRGT